MVRDLDGDTYEVMVDLGFKLYYSIHVRLHNFDTAEKNGDTAAERAHGMAATAFVTNLLPPGTKLVLNTAKAAIYNRWEAEVWYIDPKSGIQTSLRETLATNGFAKLPSYPSA